MYFYTFFYLQKIQILLEQRYQMISKQHYIYFYPRIFSHIFLNIYF